MLTKHQQEVIREALTKLELYGKVLISGSAGVGKTYSAEKLISSLPGKIYVTAPTHKALSVLRDKVTDLERITFSTLHAALKLKRKINFKTGEMTFMPDFSPKYPPLKGISYIVVDEGSMVGETLLHLLVEFAKEANCKIIFLGDDKQINPVGEENSPIFHKDYPTVELTEIVRQGVGNPIIDLSRNLDLIEGKVDNMVEVDYDEERGSIFNGYTFSNDRDKVIESLARVNGTDEIKYIAWTNKEVDAINHDVRQRIYTSPNKIELGETLIFNTPYNEDFHTNEEIKVTQVKVQTFPLKYLTKNTRMEIQTADIEMKVYCINPSSTVHKDVTLPPGVLVIHEDSEQAFKDIVAGMKQACKSYQLQWRDYYHFIEKFADLKYNHALTFHKCQGSTFEKVIMNVGNIKKNKNKVERERLTYTGVTRASDLLILYNT